MLWPYLTWCLRSSPKHLSNVLPSNWLGCCRTEQPHSLRMLVEMLTRWGSEPWLCPVIMIFWKNGFYNAGLSCLLLLAQVWGVLLCPRNLMPKVKVETAEIKVWDCSARVLCLYLEKITPGATCICQPWNTALRRELFPGLGSHFFSPVKKSKSCFSLDDFSALYRGKKFPWFI